MYIILQFQLPSVFPNVLTLLGKDWTSELPPLLSGESNQSYQQVFLQEIEVSTYFSLCELPLTGNTSVCFRVFDMTSPEHGRNSETRCRRWLHAIPTRLSNRSSSQNYKKKQQKKKKTTHTHKRIKKLAFNLN